MRSIDEYFEKYPLNIIGFRSNKDLKIIDVWLNKKWGFNKLDDNLTIKKQKDDDERGLSYYVMYSDKYTFDELYHFAVSVIEYNLEVEKKQELFSKKMNELKDMFGELSYEELLTLKFNTEHMFGVKADPSDVHENLELEDEKELVE